MLLGASGEGSLFSIVGWNVPIAEPEFALLSAEPCSADALPAAWDECIREAIYAAPATSRVRMMAAGIRFGLRFSFLATCGGCCTRLAFRRKLMLDPRNV